jgi:hypothetical protein
MGKFRLRNLTGVNPPLHSTKNKSSKHHHHRNRLRTNKNNVAVAIVPIKQSLDEPLTVSNNTITCADNNKKSKNVGPSDFNQQFIDIGFYIHFKLTSSGRKSNDSEIKTMLSRMTTFLVWSYQHCHPDESIDKMNVLDWLKAVIMKHCSVITDYCKYMEEEQEFDMKTCQNILYQLRKVISWFVFIAEYDGLVEANASKILFYISEYTKAYGKRKGNKFVDNSFETKVRNRELPAIGMETLYDAVLSEKINWLDKFLGKFNRIFLVYI